MSLNEMLATWPRERLEKELAQQAKDNAALRERVARLECELFWLKVPAAQLDERALMAARAEGRAEAVLIILSMEPEDALNDCMAGSGPCPATGEYDTHWDDEKLRAKFMVGDSTINMETKAELAYYEYQEARMVLEYEAMQRREQAAPNFEAWFSAAAAEFKAYDRDYSRKVWAVAMLSCRAAPAPEPNPPASTCWCHTCRPVTLDDCRMVLCPTCGNKRCPRANDHRHECTDSNEPGQAGSAYPAEWTLPGETPP
jgi:hypothetical protein